MSTATMPWRTFLARSAIGAAMVGAAVFAGVRLATADPGGPTRDTLTFAGVLRERASTTGNTLTFVFRKGTTGAPACTATTLPFAIDANGAFSVAVPLGGCPDPRGLFDGDSVVYDVRIGSATGDLLVSDVAVTPVPYARFADQVGANNDCPAGYTRDMALGGELRLCRRGNDEVVRVGRGAGAFWIDRHEATVWSMPDGNGTLYNSDTEVDLNTLGLARSGEWTDPPPARLYAASVSGRLPARWVTWFQAAELCRASGKRLPTGEEWIAAARGTPDPATNELGDGRERRCLTNVSGPGRTGERAPIVGAIGCQSRWGALDMIGNVWEWTAEWYASVGQVTSVAQTTIGARVAGIRVNDAVTAWPTGYGGDSTDNVTSTVVNDSEGRTGIPAAAFRGGNWGYRTLAGVNTLALSYGPSSWNADVGFRCVVPR